MCVLVSVSVEGDFFVSGGGLSSRFRVGTITFHWGRCNATSDGSEHSLNGMKYPLEVQKYTASVYSSINTFIDHTSACLTCLFRACFVQMQIFCYDPDDFHNLEDAVREGGRIAALAVLFEVDRPVVLCPRVRDQPVPPQISESGSNKSAYLPSLYRNSLTCFSTGQFGRQRELQSCYRSRQHCQQVW